MTDSVDRGPSRVAWPPIVFLCAAVLGVILAYAVPLPWIGSPLSDILFAAGWLLAAAALLSIAMALRTLRRADTTVMATRSARHLVTGGPYAFSRNPIYLGMAALLFAVGLITGSVWFLLASILAAIVTQKLAIEPEERHLAERFGKRYRDYQKKARRWF
ncbi:isoprenylcysteine carboxylmethyltransferase family protein [Chelativorans sp. M5D2P16]|uniref:methyltransferase family protein n=1 Tax=Chelativorans sp. M5D2P16 TaxID=3095678 RepID=UPI002ACA4A41|nr:isoprenylcysteine carboxylmethyltransferase family protein [Chelativorans sp. M5D2P16]MDZ5696962.1 isoprenylcysteine carboxylmethyltransferase family protein [Chelativorans sp. M5D2P16]